MDLSLVPYHQTSKSEQTHHHDNHNHQHPNFNINLNIINNNNNTHNSNFNVKYKECMRNHAASIGGHANDGCGEFMPLAGSGDDNSRLTCAACGCHRNFHRKEGDQLQQHRLLLLPSPPPTTGGSGSFGKKGMHLGGSHEYSDDYDDDHDRRSETPERGEVNVGGRAAYAAAKNKRFRTKFSQEQKDRMLEFAEKIGWRINRHDDVALNQFCNEVRVKRNVLKVWMHNNKNAHRRNTRQEPPPPPPPSTVVAPPPPQPVGV